MAAIETHELAREFEGGIKAVDGVDLEVAAGEIYGFLGPNGAGKTTTVRMLTTLLRPTGGRAAVAGHDVAQDPGAVRRKIGVALQEAALDPLMTGRELLDLQATLHGISKKDARNKGALAPQPRRAHPRRGPSHRHLLRRHAAAARPRGGADEHARGPLSR